MRGSSGRVITALGVIGLIALVSYALPTARDIIGVNTGDLDEIDAMLSRGPQTTSISAPSNQRKATLGGPTTPFRPGLTLTHLWARQGYEHHGRWDPTARVTVKLEGFLTDRNVVRVELFRNNEFLRNLDVNTNSDDKGRWLFRTKFTKNIRESIYTFRVYDKWDRVYDKSYSFYPRVTRFHWNGKTDGTFAIPFSKYDPRIDRYFLVRAGATRDHQRSRPVKGETSPSFESW